MKKQITFVRLFLMALGLFTLLVGSAITYQVGPLFRAFKGDALFGVSTVAFVLGVFLVIGGTCLAIRGRKYGSCEA
jgi:hypothetical protein